jgi:stage V sporulation protein G
MKMEKEEIMMKIDVEMKMVFKGTDAPLKAVAVVILDDCFLIHSVKVIDIGGGPFISLPSQRGRDGKWRSVCHPMNNEFRKELQEKVLEAYFEE